MPFKSSFVKTDEEGKATTGFKSGFVQPAKKGFTSSFVAEPERVGALESIGAHALSGILTIPKIVGELAELAMEDLPGFRATARALSDITGIGEGGQLGRQMREAQEFLRKKVGPDKASQLIGQSIETIATVGSAIGIGALTGGTISPLVTLSTGAGVDKTSEAVREGQPKLNAYGAGFVSAATEYFTEKIPLNVLGDPALGFFTRLAGGVISDIPGEMAATAMELSVIDKQILNKDHHLEWGEYFKILGDTAAVSAISTVGLSSASQAVNRIKRGGPLGDVPDGVSQLQDAIRGIPPAETVEPVETNPQSPVDKVTRENSKSEFIGLQGETNPTGPRQELDLRPNTQDAITPFNVEEKAADVKDRTSVDAIYDEVNAFKKDKGSLKTKSNKLKKSLIKGIVDVTGNLKGKLAEFGDDGLRVAMHRDLVAGAGSKASDDLSIASREIFSGMNKKQKQLFDKINFAENHLAIRAEKGARFTLPNNTTEQKLQDFLDTIPAQDLAEMRKRQVKLRNAMKFYADLLASEGLITDTQRKSLNDRKYYIPRQILEYMDPLVNKADRNGRVISVHDSGLKSLSEDGSDKIVEMDSELLLQQVIGRTYSRVFRNRASLEMARLASIEYDDSAKQKVKDDLVRFAEIVDSTKNAYEIVDLRTGETLTEEAFESKTEAENLIEGDEDIYEVRQVEVGQPIYETPDAEHRMIFAMDNGKPIRMIMPKEMANEWVVSDPILSAQASNWIGWLSGSKILKAMATGLNPEFAITNIPRDMAHIYLTTEQYSSFAPKFVYQMMQDIKEVSNDAELKEGLYKRYIDAGGGTEFLSHQHRETSKFPQLSDGMSKVADIMGYMGERSEILTRLALMNRAIKNGKSDQEAAHIARNYLDFSQGGSIAKALDTMIPFLNASIQGTRGIGRAAFKGSGKKVLGVNKTFGIKVGQIGITAMGLFLANMFNKDPETGKSIYDDVPEGEKVRNWIITTPLWFKDEDGTKRYYYMRIPKDQGQRVFATAFESMLKKQMGMEVDGDAVVDSILDFFPILPTDALPPTMDAMMGYMVNKDFWRRKDIWKGDPVTPAEEWNKYTPEVYKKIGEITGASPARTKYAVEQYTTSGNIWTSIVGYGAKQAFDELDEASMNKVVEEMFLRKPGVRRFLKSTKPEVEQQRRLKEAKIEDNTQRKQVNQAFDQLVERFYDKQTDLREVGEFLKRQKPHDVPRLQKRFRRFGKLKDVPNKRYWLNLLDLSPEYRAINYHKDWVQLGEEERLKMDQISAKVPSFRSKRFNRQFNKMRRFGEQGGR